MTKPTSLLSYPKRDREIRLGDINVAGETVAPCCPDGSGAWSLFSNPQVTP